MPGRLVRLRANPAKVRVSIRHIGERFGFEGDWYEATVRPVDDAKAHNFHTVVCDTSPEITIYQALIEAEDMDGVDLGMEWAYRHPWLDPEPRFLAKCGDA